MKLEIVHTKDLSTTVYRSDINEHYHSIHGAYQESLYVYVVSGLKQLTHLNTIRVFEMGFGTGLNILLTWIFANNYHIRTEVLTIEKNPLPQKIYKQLNYSHNAKEHTFFAQLHESKWGQKIEFSPIFSYTKLNTTLEEIDISMKFDIVFFDAFAPDKQPELWTTEMLKKMYLLLNSGGILVTYSAKGQVRRNMIQAGFEVERIPGPPGKREMIRAHRPNFS